MFGFRNRISHFDKQEIDRILASPPRTKAQSRQLEKKLKSHHFPCFVVTHKGGLPGFRQPGLFVKKSRLYVTTYGVQIFEMPTYQQYTLKWPNVLSVRTNKQETVLSKIGNVAGIGVVSGGGSFGEGLLAGAMLNMTEDTLVIGYRQLDGDNFEAQAILETSAKDQIASTITVMRAEAIRSGIDVTSSSLDRLSASPAGSSPPLSDTRRQSTPDSAASGQFVEQQKTASPAGVASAAMGVSPQGVLHVSSIEVVARSLGKAVRQFRKSPMLTRAAIVVALIILFAQTLRSCGS